VADPVAQGLTNRKAAEQVFLSPHTIDFHLRQIFHKLQIDSRVDHPPHDRAGRGGIVVT